MHCFRQGKTRNHYKDMSYCSGKDPEIKMLNEILKSLFRQRVPKCFNTLDTLNSEEWKL